MANTWITDMRHFLDETGQIANMPTPARSLAEYFGSIIMWMADSVPEWIETTNVLCRRRPRRKPCFGRIIAVMKTAGEIAWECPSCGDNGVIYGWVGTPWDRRTD